MTVIAAMTCASSAFANGAEFFQPADRNGKVDLVYVGNIRDRAGRPLDFVDLTVSVMDGTLTFPFSNNSPGHYRSPDIGAFIKETGDIIDPTQLEITCYVTGYRLARRSVPRRSQGIFEVDFIMEEDGAAPRDTSREAPAGRSSHTPAVGLIVLLLSAVGMRTATHLRSTND
ncbi:MAG: hypothetical protein M3T56_15395 [Chloroflexota bacterium]|nr:hypothetical protein [Chloroflexota bacterium]